MINQSNAHFLNNICKIFSLVITKITSHNDNEKHILFRIHFNQMKYLVTIILLLLINIITFNASHILANQMNVTNNNGLSIKLCCLYSRKASFV